MSRARSVSTWCGGLFGLLLAVVPAWGSSGGITGFSGNPATGGATCNGCHAGGVIPIVTLTGATSVQPGTVHTYQLKIRGGQQIAGGLDVSASGGALGVTEPGTQLVGAEITHTIPRNTDANREVIWNFNWAAPLAPGTFTLYGAGNSVDLAQGFNGDAAATATLTIDVISDTATPGESSGPSLSPLRVTGYDAGTGKISISFESGCGTTDNNLYFGPLSQVGAYAWSGEDCGVGAGPTYADFDPGPDSVFFVVVGHDGTDEGSYGLKSGGPPNERPPFGASLCPQDQNLLNPCD